MDGHAEVLGMCQGLSQKDCEALSLQMHLTVQHEQIIPVQTFWSNICRPTLNGSTLM